MKIAFDFTEQDYIDFNMHYYETSPTMRRSLNKSRIAGTLICFMMPFVAKDFGRVPFPYLMGGLGIMGILWFFFFPSRLQKLYLKQIKKMLQEKPNTFFGPKTLELRDDGIMVKGDAQESLNTYSSISQMYEHKGSIYLYNSAVSALIIPASAFSSSSERQAFLDALRPRLTLKEEATSNRIFSKLEKM